jgi:mannose-6-phosphate isomerase-like protein (cupin superfamily)
VQYLSAPAGRVLQLGQSELTSCRRREARRVQGSRHAGEAEGFIFRKQTETLTLGDVLAHRLGQQHAHRNARRRGVRHTGHHHRAEHWIVVSGTAKVTRGEEVSLLSENESTFIPLGTTHRLENPGRVELEMIEVQSGSYLGEDDIVRFEDVYGR